MYEENLDFLRALLHRDVESAKAKLVAILPHETPRGRSISFKVDHIPTAGVDSVFADIYCEVPGVSYGDFGNVYVRVWAIGSPPILLYGLYMGSKVSKAQSEIRRGVAYTRQRLESVLRELEGQRGFSYTEWTDRLVDFLGNSGSRRGAVRLLDTLITYKFGPFQQTGESDLQGAWDDIKAVLALLDTIADVLSPHQDYKQNVIGRWFDLPFDTGAAPELADSLRVRWPTADSKDPSPGGLLGLEAQVRQALAALSSGKHLVLVGAPGTGKTELAAAICSGLGARYSIATATSEWSTFETIGGYLPSPSKGGVLEFRPGIVLRALRNRRWLIIDELNRADMDKAFGELFTVLGGTDRSVTLPFETEGEAGPRPVVVGAAGESMDADLFDVPEDWRLVATMNTFDKASLYQLSYAFMRRFAFVQIPIPEKEIYSRLLRSAAQSALGGDPGFHDAALPALMKLFVPEPDTGLAVRGLIVGPAIPLDIVSYLKHRRALESTPPSAEDTRTFLLEAVAILLFPQFEGRDTDQGAIVSAVADSLGLTDKELEKCSSMLAVWTGYQGA